MPARILPKAIQVVATLLELETATRGANVVSMGVMKRLELLLAIVECVAEAMQDMTAESRKAPDRLYNMSKDARDELQKAAGVMKDEVSRAVEGACEEIMKVSEGLRASADKAGSGGEVRRGGQEGTPTYMAVLNSRLPAAHQSNLARVRGRDWLVLIDKDPAAKTNNLGGLNERELVVKANEALARMKEASGGGPEGARMIGARKLRNGGVVYELSDLEAAKWLRWERATFVVNFGGTFMLKEREVAIIIEFVPISYNPDVLAESQKVEHNSRLEAGAIVSTRWIKPVQRWADGQWMATPYC